jgi:hypothetical protein
VTPPAPTKWQVLAQRAGNGVEVAILWSPPATHVKVAVSDERICHHVDLELAGADALSAFRHSFADATSDLLEQAESAASDR